MSNLKRFVVLWFAFAIAAVPALAVEGALGRSLPGVWVQPEAGVVGPDPGFG